MESSYELDHQDIRDAVKQLCGDFPGKYWRKCDRDQAYPQDFVQALTESGFLGALIPEEFGGSGLPISAGAAILETIHYSGCNAAACHAQMYTMGTVLRHGSDEQKQQYLPGIADGSIRLQAFGVTEPTSGTDTSALSTTAKRDGDNYITNGQKIWTSGAQYSDFGIIVLRTDPNLPKHQGLSYFFLDMKSPGIEIKPIKQMSGASGFNEVYFTDVRVSDAQRLGEVGQGWQVALTTLMNERASIGGGGGAAGFKTAMDLANRINIDDKPAIEDKHVRAQLANWYVQESGLKFTGYRSMTALSKGEIPGPENSIGKLVGAPKSQDLASFAMDLMEQAGIVLDPDGDEMANLFQGTYMSIPGLRIAGGTDEIMANIIAERVLGLPQDVRVDKGIPFTDVPTSN